jgi:muramoyltetrapeptide carboxypeptidase
MTVIVDPPNASGHGRLWSHVASDSDFGELHAFARALGIPERGFDRDHYDIPADWYDRVVAAGAEPVSSRELITRLATAGLRRPKAYTFAPRRPGRPLLRPPRLRAADLVAVVTPAGPVDPGRLAAGVEVLRSWGLEVTLPRPRQDPTPGWLAGSDRERAAELTEAWTHPDVRAVWMSRGGYGTQRILDLLDWPALASSSPRLLVGFSDLTALHQAVAARLGAATVHAAGVAGLGDGDRTTAEATRDLVMGSGGAQLRGTPTPGGGSAEGILVGGNVSLLASSCGTPFTRPATGGVALLEDVGEQPYRLDRALTQLLRSGWFEGVRGVCLGGFPGCGDPAEVRAVLDERLGPLAVPVLHGLPVGHLTKNLPVPLGVPARLDVSAGTLTVPRSLR